jgi:hypothetical protein
MMLAHIGMMQAIRRDRKTGRSFDAATFRQAAY